MYDLLITGARLIDGTGTPWYWADVAVQGDRIVAVGALSGTAAQRVINAGGRIVCPGFIDMHTHSDLYPLYNPLMECKIRQGVTTEVVGHDGLGLSPVTPKTAAMLREQLAGWNGRPDLEWDWSTITTYLDRFEHKVALNVATHVSHGTMRMAVMGMENRPPTADEMRRMQALIDQSMREGAIGLSTGLTYAPCMFASDEEMVELCKAMRPYNGFYCPHHRNYGMTALQAYYDSIEIGRKAGVPVHLTHCHLGYTVNKGRAPELLAAIDQARAEGVEVTMDTYPYLAGNTYLHAFLPTWMHEGGTEATLARLKTPDLQERLRHEMEVTGSDGFSDVPMGWEMLQIGGIMGEHDPALVGMFLPDAATRAGQTPYEFFVDLLIQTRLGVSCLAHIGNEENVQTILQHPAHVVGSDGILVGGRPHPRGWGTHVRFLAHYVRDMGLLTWEEGIRKMTSATARRIGCMDRGLIRPGFMADLVVFDPDTLRDTATYENPISYPEGVHFVAVNGILVVENSQTTGATPGRAFREPYGRKPERVIELIL
ncbi:MAG: D-aminoacylase [Anaerolineales bacterium]|nr:D-aminoacylase [Anaerolineales bacterium]